MYRKGVLVKRKFFVFIVLVCFMTFVGCNQHAVSETEDSDETIEIEREVTRITGDTSNEPDPVHVTIASNESEVRDEVNVDETYFTRYAQQTDEWSEYSFIDLSQLTVPGYDYASNRVEITLEVFTQDYEGTMMTTWDGRPSVSFVDWHDNSEHGGVFVLDGITLPDSSENPILAMSLFNMMNKICTEDCINVYIETDMIPDENGNYHGFIYFTPNVDDLLMGQVGYDNYTELTQLNEWLLAHGFAAPDRNYSGRYADVYQQYPDFNEGYAGYPLLLPDWEQENWGDYDFILYDPSVPIEAYADYGFQP